MRPRRDLAVRGEFLHHRSFPPGGLVDHGQSPAADYPGAGNRGPWAALSLGVIPSAGCWHLRDVDPGRAHHPLVARPLQRVGMHDDQHPPR